ncbi:uroporphyrinogen-III synthase [Microbacterium sp. X-17]|uniref:uroporphyrinogen-III synthase n=1 Tax=Microbacterium sp. X-17 TaxID=3144404 RepID=UPI0031F59127
MTLAGRRVLIPRGGAWGERVRAALAARGAEGVVAPLIVSGAPIDVAARDRAFRAIADAAYTWLFVTSAASIDQLAAEGVVVPPGTRVAVVGAATARAAKDAGIPVAFEPAGASSGAALAAQWCAAHSPDGRVLVLRSDLATATVSDELEARGHAVDVCVAYRTVGVDLAPDVDESLRTGGFDAVLLTSLSVGRELRRQVGALPERTVIASIGPGTTHDAGALGIRVDVTAAAQSVEAILDALDAHFSLDPALSRGPGERNETA